MPNFTYTPSYIDITAQVQKPYPDPVYQFFYVPIVDHVTDPWDYDATNNPNNQLEIPDLFTPSVCRLYPENYVNTPYIVKDIFVRVRYTSSSNLSLPAIEDTIVIYALKDLSTAFNFAFADPSMTLSTDEAGNVESGVLPAYNHVIGIKGTGLLGPADFIRWPSGTGFPDPFLINPNYKYDGAVVFQLGNVIGCTVEYFQIFDGWNWQFKITEMTADTASIEIVAYFVETPGKLFSDYIVWSDIHNADILDWWSFQKVDLRKTLQIKKARASTPATAGLAAFHTNPYIMVPCDTGYTNYSLANAFGEFKVYVDGQPFDLTEQTDYELTITPFSHLGPVSIYLNYDWDTGEWVIGENAPGDWTETSYYGWDFKFKILESGIELKSDITIIKTQVGGGKKIHSGRVYLQASSDTKPTGPTATSYTFSTETFTGLTAGWSTAIPSFANGGKYWSAYYYCEESSVGSDTCTPSINSTTSMVASFSKGVSTAALQQENGATIHGRNVITQTLPVEAIKFGGTNVQAGMKVALGANDRVLEASTENSDEAASFFENTPDSLDGAYGLLGYVISTVYTAAKFFNLDGAGADNNGAVIGNDSYGLTVTGGIAPFTGCHDAMMIATEGAVPGDIMVDVEVVHRASLSDVVTLVARSTEAEQRGAVGVLVKRNTQLPHSMLRQNGREEPSLKADVTYPLDGLVPVAINSLGEGQILVCPEGGDLEVGDLIETSSVHGKGRRQSDYVIRSSTVARCRERVSFSHQEDVRLVACIYLCG